MIIGANPLVIFYKSDVIIVSTAVINVRLLMCSARDQYAVFFSPQLLHETFRSRPSRAGFEIYIASLRTVAGDL